MSLFFAGNRWGDSTGIFEYTKEANQILHDMLHKEEDNGGKIDGITNMFDIAQKKVVFVPQGNNALFTDPSYHLPGFYKLWSKWAKADTSFWSAATDTSAAFLTRAAHPTSGLVTDFMSFEGLPQPISFNENSVRFAYDSWRVVGNIGMYAHWFGSKDWTVNFNNKTLGFFTSQGAGYLGVYEQEGTPLATNNYHSTGLVAMNSAGVLSANKGTTSWPFVNELWNLGIPTGTYRYYDGMLYMLSLLHSSGNFRIWKPETVTGLQVSAEQSGSLLSVFPNPGTNVYIEASENFPIVVMNSTGTEVWSGNVLAWNNAHVSLAKGLYVVTAKDDKVVTTKKFVIE